MKSLVAIRATVRAPGYEVWCVGSEAEARFRIESLAAAGTCDELLVFAPGMRFESAGANVRVISEAGALPPGVSVSEQLLPAIKESGFGSLIDAAVRATRS